MAKIISYVRVSTKRQGASGLGLEAQREAIAGYVKREGHTIVGEFCEVESGRRCDRVQLQQALGRCRLLGAVLCIAKLDRLGRDVAFLSSLMTNGVEFVCCDNPHANRLTIHILAAVAEDEARRISDRIKAALSVARSRGTVLGGPRNHRLTSDDQRRGSATLNRLQKEGALARARSVMPIIDELRAGEGRRSLQALADGLNQRGIPAARGGRWHAAQVGLVLGRAGG
jgi:DNA invertase Pin-like site-specific DNA recombinase